jgi:4-hydroxybenzoate polyprenyltransferase
MMVYLKLFRWPNLLMVALIQVLFRYGIIDPILRSEGIELALSHADFALLVLATVLITAAGYAINDYFDLRTDRINKPHRIILGRQISRRKAIFFHSLFNILAVVTGAWLAYRSGYWPMVFVFIIIPTLLWLYSVRYKKKYLLGNIIIAFLAAFVIGIVWALESAALAAQGINTENLFVISGFSHIYALFAFLTTFTREIIKDIEDIKGDAKTGCRTMPVVSGIRKTKKLIISLIIITFLFIAWVQIYLLLRDFDVIFSYLLLTVQIPFILMINKTLLAKEKTDYHYLSLFAKWIMLAGILSMFLFNFYLQNGFPIDP